MKSFTELTKQLHISLRKNKSSALPLYKKLYEALRQQILDGFLLPETRLPSSRIIAKQLGLARNTVLTALEQLSAEGYVGARDRSGIYVLATAPSHWHAHKRFAPPLKSELSIRGNEIAKQAQMVAMRGAFVPGIPDLKQFPFDLWQRYVARYARNPKIDWQAYPNQGGDLELRKTLVNYLRLARGICCDATQILITNGTQNSLRLIADLLADPKDEVWIENPGYLGARTAFHAAGLTLVHKAVDTEGLLLSSEMWQRPPRLIYTTPSHQYPTGAIMSAARRRSLLASASQHHTWIIEDDYDSEFRYEGAPLAALHALSPDQVIYLGTFSKTFFPSLRIGYMVLPKQLVDAFRKTQARHHREPSYIIQRALAHFISDGHGSAHIRKMRREYQFRRDTLVKILKRECSDQLYLDGLNTGLHFVAYLPMGYDDQTIADQAKQKGVMTHALSGYYASDTSYRQGLVLGFGDVDQKDIVRAGKILCGIINANAHKKTR